MREREEEVGRLLATEEREVSADEWSVVLAHILGIQVND